MCLDMHITQGQGSYARQEPVTHHCERLDGHHGAHRCGCGAEWTKS
jgi:hypothetical protein